MRIWRHLKISVPLLLAMTAIAETSAQEFGGYPSYGAPAFMAGQGYPGGPQQGMPQSFQSHPMISPFDNAFEQHFNTDGLWFRRAIGAMSPMNDYYFNVDYINIRSRGLTGHIGDRNAPTPDQDQNLLTTTPTREISDTFPDTVLLPSFAHHNANVNGDNNMNGIRLSGGIKNRAGWRFAWNVAYGGETSEIFDARANLFRNRLHGAEARFLEESGGTVNSIPPNLSSLDEQRILEEDVLGRRVFDSANADEYGLLGSTEDLIDRGLYPYGSIGLQDGGGPDSDIDGFSQMFDLGFAIEQQVEYFNSGFHFSTSPAYETDSIQIRPIIGGRMTRLTEGFFFRGADSGLVYTSSTPNGLDDDDDFVVDNVEENGDIAATDPLTTPDRQILVRSFVSNVIRSTMAGPEAGIEYDITKHRSLQLSGSTRVGVLFNHERMDLSGDNIGNTMAVDTDGNGDLARTDLFDTSTDLVAETANAFTDSGKSTHLSPMFEQSLNANIPLFSRVPVLRDIWQLEEAKLRLGWTYTWIAEVADPSQSIIWKAEPTAGVTPTLKVRRSSYFQNQFNVGINWEF